MSLYIEDKIEDDTSDEEAATQNKTITVTDIRMPVIDGNTVVYITDENGEVYKQLLSDNESLMLVTIGKKYTVEYFDTDVKQIKQIYSITENKE